MSKQRVTPSQRELIVETLQNMLNAEGKSPGSIIREFQQWCEKKEIECDLSHETIRKWCAVAKGDDRKLKNHPQKGGQLIRFSLERKKRLDPDNLEGMLVRSVGGLFADSGNSSPNQLRHLHGRYLIIRRRWRRPTDEGEFMQGIVEFETAGDRTVFREIQKLGGLGSRAADKIDEEHTGYAFIFASNIFALAYEKNRTSVKFLTIHHCEPYLLHASSPINTCRGNLIAVAGPEPNQSHRFVLIRNDTKTKCEYLRQARLKDFMYKDDIDYLCFRNET